MNILPCPLCGNDDLDEYHNTMLKISVILCQNCDYRIKLDKWNTTSSLWISVKDRLPEKNGSYLVFISKYHPYNNEKITDTFMEVDLFVDNLFHKELPGASLYGINKVTHWMPLPSLPEK